MLKTQQKRIFLFWTCRAGSSPAARTIPLSSGRSHIGFGVCIGIDPPPPLRASPSSGALRSVAACPEKGREFDSDTEPDSRPREGERTGWKSVARGSCRARLHAAPLPVGPPRP